MISYIHDHQPPHMQEESAANYRIISSVCAVLKPSEISEENENNERR